MREFGHYFTFAGPVIPPDKSKQRRSTKTPGIWRPFHTLVGLNIASTMFGNYWSGPSKSAPWTGRRRSG